MFIWEERATCHCNSQKSIGYFFGFISFLETPSCFRQTQVFTVEGSRQFYITYHLWSSLFLHWSRPLLEKEAMRWSCNRTSGQGCNWEETDLNIYIDVSIQIQRVTNWIPLRIDIKRGTYIGTPGQGTSKESTTPTSKKQRPLIWAIK